MPKIIGLCGSIGSGKSLVCNILSTKFQIPFVDTDLIAHSLFLDINYQQELKTTIKHFLKEEEFSKENLRNLIFTNPKARKIVNDFSHPKILAKAKLELKKFNTNFVIFAVPLLFENLDFYNLVTFSVAVLADEKIKIKRIIKRDQVDKIQAKKILNIQKPDSYLKTKATFSIYNNKTKLELKKEIKKLYFNQLCFLNLTN